LKKETGWKMYLEIQQLKKMGLKISQIARKMSISRPTVYEYLNMRPEEFEERLNRLQQRAKKPDRYHNEILEWLKEYPDMSGSQVYDRLEEKYKKLDFSESTLRNYLRELRTMGKQTQVDFGQMLIKRFDGAEIRLYVMGFVLSHSRQKYCQWQDRPFTTSDIIRIQEDAIEYFGGMTEEYVYDQDRLILVSENHGDLIYTQEFAAYMQKRRFRIRICRKGDPQSKGRIESVVKYVKNNFARHRIFHNLDRWNEDCIAWLDRRANGKVHGTTKKIPAEVFKEERKYLRPVTEKINKKSSGLSITYLVRKDNTVLIKGNRYSVPLGTYQGPRTYVKVTKIDDDYLIIQSLDTNEELARHKIAVGKGNLQKNNNHKRDKSQTIEVLMNNIIAKFSDPSAAGIFIRRIHEDKPRYIRDQLMVIQSVLNNHPAKVINKALSFCLQNKLFSAGDFKDAANHYGKEKENVGPESIEVIPLLPDSKEKIKTRPQIRSITEYKRVFNKTTGI